MAKPLTAPWATDANYPAGAEPEAGTPTKVAYTLGQATTGWRPKGKPPAQEWYRWMNRVGAWTVYLDAGIWEDDLTIAAGKKIIPADGNLKVDGTLTAGDTIANPSSVIAAGGNLIARASNPGAEDNGKVYWDGIERMPFSTMLAQDPAAAHALTYNQLTLAATADPVRIPIIGIPVGAAIVGMKVWFKKGTDDSAELVFTVVKSQNGGADDYNADAVAIADATNATGDKATEITGAELFVESGYQYHLRIDPWGSVAPAADKFYQAEILWSKPEL